VMGQVVELLKLNADKKLITKKLFENISVWQMMLMQRVFGRLRVDGRLASIWYTTADYADVWLDEGDSKIITSIMSLLWYPAISLIIRVKAVDPIVDGTGRYIQTVSCSCSLRSRDEKTLVQPIAALFGGWGHAYAAGFKVSHDIRLMTDTSYSDGVQEMIEGIVVKVVGEVNG
jgi:nanoRNase/pAp phosphatase (c-di-AMP/oligoRNAs hydrolase)